MLFALRMPCFELRTYQSIVETTGHTLAATLAFLALHNDIQEEVYEQITSVVGPDRDPVGVYMGYPGLPPLILLLKVFGDYPKLDKVLAVFYEALRMFRSSILIHPLFLAPGPDHPNSNQLLPISWSAKRMKTLCCKFPTHMDKKG